MEKIVLDIEKPAHRGTAIARHEGQVVFVRGAIPGEKQVQVLLDPDFSSSFLRGSAISVPQPSPYRQASLCRAARRGAGCCDLDFLTPEGSLEWKKQVICDQVQRIAHQTVNPSAVSLSPHQEWRTRVRLGRHHSGKPGIYRSRSSEVIPLSKATCAQWVPGLTDGLEDVILYPGEELVVAQGSDGQRSAVAILAKGSRRNRKKPRIRIVEGRGTIVHDLNGVPLTIPVESFWQAHKAAPDFYRTWIKEQLSDISSSGTPGPHHAWDLYGGAGSFIPALLENHDSVLSIDNASPSVEAGKKLFCDPAVLAHYSHNPAEQKLKEVHFIAGNVEKVMSSLKKDHLSTICLDPPRTGAGAKVIRALSSYGAQHIIHIGCDPATAARDLHTWNECGYTLHDSCVVDAFGLTHHIEFLMHLVPAKENSYS